MEEELVVAENLSQQMVFLGIELIIAVICYLIAYWFYKYGKKYEILNKFVSMPIVQNIIIDFKYILTNYLKIKIKKKMKEHKIGEGEKSDVEASIPPELLKKYGDSIKTLSKDSIEKLKKMEEEKNPS